MFVLSHLLNFFLCKLLYACKLISLHFEWFAVLFLQIRFEDLLLLLRLRLTITVVSFKNPIPII